MYERILMPTDGNDRAEAAMEEAMALAEAADATVHVLHVINSRRYDTSIDSATEPLRERGDRYVDKLVEVADGADTPLVTAIEIGRPAQQILEYAAGNEINLIVMGTRGRGGLPGRLLGSVTNYVVTHADVPVHVVPSPDRSDT